MAPRELDAGNFGHELAPAGASSTEGRRTASGARAARGTLCTWSLLFDIPEIVSTTSFRPDEIAASALAAALKILGATRGLLLVHERSRELAIRAAEGLPADLDPASPGGAAIGRVIEDALRADRAVAREAAIAVPLRGLIREASGGPVERRRFPQEKLLKQVGAIYVDRDPGRPFGPPDLERAEAFAEHAARALLLARLRHTATVDPLTGFYTRAELEPCLGVEMTVSTHANMPLALLLVEVDLDRLVEEKGRRFADETLGRLADRIRRGLRTEDLPFRYGAGKLILLLPGADQEGALGAFERLKRAAAGDGAADAPISVSCGIAIFPHHADRKGELVKKADQALFVAEGKSSTGGAVEVWSRAISKYALRTDKLIGIITGDPARDYRNVLLLLDAIAVVNSIREREPLLSAIVDMLIELTDAERGIVFVPEAAARPRPSSIGPEDTQRLLEAAVLGEEAASAASGEGKEGKRPARSGLVVALAQDADKRRIASGAYCEGVVEKVARTGLPVCVLDYLGEDDPAVEERIRELGLRLVICVPLKVQERLAGVLYVDSRTAAREVGEADLIFFQALAREIAVALENARLYEENLRARHEVEELNRKLARKVRKQAHELEEAKAVIEVELKTKYDYDKIVGKSPRMQEIYRLLDRITDTDVPVLIQGESGTGKELVAKAIHYNGPRKRRRFVSVNCAAIAPTLLESELFGHVKGSFTGADRDKPGLFEQADQGTIFLDEVQDMPAQLQRELLRVLQEKEVRRVGGKDVIPVNVRVLSAANRDLKDLMKRSTFREDLYYRLAVVTIDLPPLRDRMEDLPLIVDRYLRDLCRAQSRSLVTLDKAGLRKLLRHDWPGNVRELHNALERALLMIDGETIDESALEIEAVGGARAAHAAATAGAGQSSPPSAPDSATGEAAHVDPAYFEMPYKEAAEAFKTEYIRRLLARYAGNVTRASEQSGLFRSSFHKIMRKLDVSAREIRTASGERPAAE